MTASCWAVESPAIVRTMTVDVVVGAGEVVSAGELESVGEGVALSEAAGVSLGVGVSVGVGEVASGDGDGSGEGETVSVGEGEGDSCACAIEIAPTAPPNCERTIARGMTSEIRRYARRIEGFEPGPMLLTPNSPTMPLRGTGRFRSLRGVPASTITRSG
jgi:hypothetical protein